MSNLINKPSFKVIALDDKGSMLKLPIIGSLLEEFHKKDILYCHWKSNEHLAASMVADTDLDILFKEQQREDVTQLLECIGFKKFTAIKQKQYKDIEDFLCLDPSSGKIIHLHAHFRLTLGETYLKSYQLDWEDKILSTRIFDEGYGIYRIVPAFEMILLIFREALKIRHRQILKMYLKRRVIISRNTQNEYEWLKQRCTEHQIELVLRSLFIDYQPIFRFVTGEFNLKNLRKLSFLLKKQLLQYRQCSPSVALFKRWHRELSIKFNRQVSRIIRRPLLIQRVNPRGGFIIAIIGADGSGKSTVTSHLQSVLMKKLDVYRIYFGRGDGAMSTSRKILLYIRKVILSDKEKKHKLKSELEYSSSHRNGFIYNVYKIAEAILVANEKLRNVRLMQRAKRKGMVVICDRYPQNQIMGFNDGPLLYHLFQSHNPFYRLVAKTEAYVYSLAAITPPDILFKLIADAEVVEARKPGEVSLERLEKKIEGFKRLTFVSPCKVVDVNAGQSLEQVLYTINEEIWNLCP